MKILVVSDYSTPTGGAEIYVLQLRSLLREAGHDVLLFSSSVGTQNQRLADIECWGSNGKIANRLLQTFNPFAYFKIRRVLKRFRPDLVHLNLFLTQLSPSLLIALRHTPVVYTSHSYKIICPLGSKLLPNGKNCTVRAGKACLKNKCLPFPLWLIDMVQLSLIRRNLKYIDLILANSANTGRLLHDAGIPVTKVQSYFQSTDYRNLPFPTTDPTVCFIGRLVPEKGVDILLRAMQLVVNELPEAHLLIVGDGREKQFLQNLSEHLDLSEVVEFLGYVPPQRLDEVWLRAHLQVVPSTWSEPFGLVAAEAMAVGRPVVVTCGGGLEETVVDGECGYLVSPGNVMELSSKILTILQNPKLARRMGRRGSEIIKQKLNNREILNQTLDIYNSVRQNKQSEINKNSSKEWKIALANNMNCEEGHLGGYIKASPLPAPSGLRISHGDPATYTPALWRWVYETLGVRSVLDVGCGECHCAALFSNLGCRVRGVDGSIQARQNSVLPEFHIIHDFVAGPYVTEEEFDLVWSCEFVEHVEEKYVENFLSTFRSSRRFIMMTYAPPGQAGWHHVNCRPEHYWIDHLARSGFTFDPELTTEARRIAEPGHFRRKGLLFVRDNSLQDNKDQEKLFGT